MIRPLGPRFFPRPSTTILVLLVTTASVAADVVVTTNGSRIVGTLERMTADSAVIVTEFAGKLEIPADKVANVITDQDVAVRFDSGDQLIGKLTETPNGNVVMKSGIGDIPVTREKMSAVWPKDADSPEVIQLKVAQAKKLAAITPNWSVTLEGGGSRTEGNTDTLDGRGRLDVKRKTDIDLLTFFLYGEYSENNKVRTKNEYGGGVRFEAQARDDIFWYTRLQMEHDEFENLDLRTTAAAGWAQYWIKKPEREFKTSVGLAFRHESYNNGTTTSDPTVDLGLDYRHDIAPWVQFTQSISYRPAWTSFSDYRLDSLSALVFPLKNDNLKLKAGVRYEYNSRPNRGLDRLDTTYFANVVLTLK